MLLLSFPPSRVNGLMAAGLNFRKAPNSLISRRWQHGRITPVDGRNAGGAHRSVYAEWVIFAPVGVGVGVGAAACPSTPEIARRPANYAECQQEPSLSPMERPKSVGEH
jgi:hypothetical protein